MPYDLDEIESEIAQAARTINTEALGKLCKRSVWKDADFIERIAVLRNRLISKACILLTQSGPSSTGDDFENLAMPLLQVLHTDEQKLDYIGILESLLPTLAQRNGHLAYVALECMSQACPEQSRELELQIAERAVQHLPKILTDSTAYIAKNAMSIILEAGGVTVADVTSRGADLGIFAASPEHPVICIVFNALTQQADPVFLLSDQIFPSAEVLLKDTQGCPPDMAAHFKRVIEAAQKPRPSIDWRRVLREKNVSPFPAHI